MSGSVPDPVKPPEVPEPAPVPEVQDEAEEFAMKEEGKKSGFKKTFLTGGLAPETTGKKISLG